MKYGRRGETGAWSHLGGHCYPVGRIIDDSAHDSMIAPEIGVAQVATRKYLAGEDISLFPEAVILVRILSLNHIGAFLRRKLRRP
jgi:hypothetical protein